jgi:hypothetical protein
MRVDAQGAEVRARLEAAGIDCLLLKGRGFAELLYAPDEVRGYGDSDLLVAQHDLPGAAAILRELGYRDLGHAALHVAPEPLHAEHWARESDHAAIDLHWRLRGSRASAELVFAELWAHSTEADVGGRTTRILDPVATALVCSLHVAQHARGAPGPRADLERAIDLLPTSTWVAAAALATSVDAHEAFTDGLRLIPTAAELADTLGLAASASIGRRLSTGTGPRGATALQWLLERQTRRQRLRFAVRLLAPPPGTMRRFHEPARRGRTGLLLAYVCRPARVALKAPAALGHWRAARRQAAEPGPTPIHPPRDSPSG